MAWQSLSHAYTLCLSRISQTSRGIASPCPVCFIERTVEQMHVLHKSGVSGF